MDEIKRINRKLAYEGTVIKVYQDEMLVNNERTAYWDFIHHDGAAAVVAVTDEGKLLMVKQYRNALDRETIELPAGKLDFVGEDTLSCAKRELEEETGYASDDLTFLLSICTTVALCNEKIDIYLAKNLRLSKQHLDEDEYIQVEAYSVEELLTMIYQGKILDSKTVSGILAYANQLK